MKRLLFAILFYLSWPATAQVDVFDFSRVGGNNHRCVEAGLVGDVLISRNNEEKEAIETCLNTLADNPDKIFDVVTESRIRVRINKEALAQASIGVNNSTIGTVADDPPEWPLTPDPTCTEGVASSIDLTPAYEDAEDGNAVTLTEQGCTWPPGVTVDDTNKEIDCADTTSEGTTASCQVGADDGVNSRVDSNPFNIVVTPAEDYEAILADMKGYADHYGVDGGAGGTLVTVTNLNNSGGGSLRTAVSNASGSTWIRFSQGLSGTINLSSTIALKSDLTIDGRGANVTLTGPGGSTRVLSSLSGQENWILMYIKIIGPVGSDNDAVGIENSTGNSPGGGNDTERFWLYHVNITDAEDSLLDVIRSTGQYTVQASYFHNDTGTSHGFLLSHGSLDEYGWNAVVHEGSWVDNYFDRVRDRTVRITIPANVHMWNNYHIGWETDALVVTKHFAEGYDADAAQAFIEYSVLDGSGGPNGFSDPTLSSAAEDGEIKAENNLLLNSANIQTRNPGNVFTPPYSYTPAAATTDLRDDIIATAGWQSVDFPGDP